VQRLKEMLTLVNRVLLHGLEVFSYLGARLGMFLIETIY
jgi:hypothetical protein